MKKEFCFLIFVSMLISLVSAYNFCENGIVDENYLEITRIYDEQLDNDNEWDWSPGEKVNLTVTVANKNYSERDFVIQLLFFDEEDNENSLASDSDDLIQTQKIKDSEKVKFIFEIDESAEAGSYTLYAKVNDKNNESICTYLIAESESNEIEIEIQGDLGILVSAVSGPNLIEAGSSATYYLTVQNIGNTNQNQVLVRAYNSLLGLKEEKIIYDLGRGESQNVTFNIFFSENSSNFKIVKLDFSTEYDFSEVENYYQTVSDKSLDKSYRVNITAKTIPSEEEIIEDLNDSIDTIETTPLVTSAPASEDSGKNNLIWTIFVILLSIIILVILGKLIFKLFFNKNSTSSYTVLNSGVNSLN